MLVLDNIIIKYYTILLIKALYLSFKFTSSNYIYMICERNINNHDNVQSFCLRNYCEHL